MYKCKMKELKIQFASYFGIATYAKKTIALSGAVFTTLYFGNKF